MVDVIVRPVSYGSIVNKLTMCSNAQAVKVFSDSDIAVCGGRSSSKTVWKKDYTDASVIWDYDTYNTAGGLDLDSSENVVVVGSDTCQDEYYGSLTAWGTGILYDVLDERQNGGKAYECDVQHTSSTATEPGVGEDWGDYWSECTANAWKFDSDGNLVWRKLIQEEGGSLYDLIAVAVDSNDNIYVVQSGGCLVKLSSSGSWQWKYDTGGTIGGLSIDSNDNIFVGNYESTDEDGDAGVLRKINSSGVKQWEYNPDYPGRPSYDTGVTAVSVDTNDNDYIYIGFNDLLCKIVNATPSMEWYRKLGRYQSRGDIVGVFADSGIIICSLANTPQTYWTF